MLPMSDTALHSSVLAYVSADTLDSPWQDNLVKVGRNVVPGLSLFRSLRRDELGDITRSNSRDDLERLERLEVVAHAAEVRHESIVRESEEERERTDLSLRSRLS